MGAIFPQVVAAEARPEVLSAGILMTQAYLDVPKLGWSVLQTVQYGGKELAILVKDI